MFSRLNYTISKKYNYHTKQSIEYLNLECSFDIETSSTYVKDDKFSFMYLWGFGLGSNGEYLFYGRTWEELKIFLNELSNELGLGKNRILVCYIHNLGYEFQFMRKHFEWVNVFSVDERKPIKALSTLGIEFRDSYILSGYSLEKTAENLNNHTIEKLVGDLDYSLIRHEETEVTDEELKYLENDVLIILYYINEQLEIYGGKIQNIPLTNTGRVRTFVKDKCYYTENKSKYKSSKGKMRNYREIMERLTLEPEEYEKLKWSFMGGFTHANAYYTNKVLENVHSVDFTSSYPSVMLSEMYPMGKGFKPTKEEILKNGYDYYLNKFCCLIGVVYTGLENKFYHDSYLSESKCKIKGEKLLNNGRVYKAEVVSTYLTDIDYWVMSKCYKWESVEIKDLTCYPKGYLPKPIIESVLELYQNKTKLKGIKGKEVEYLLSKGMLNSVYGMMVTDIVRDNIIYDDEWRTEETDKIEEIEKYNNKRSRFLFYPWGVWVTAYARRNLWLGILHMKEDYIYSDTDSIKFMNKEKHIKFFNDYNKWVEQKQIATLEYYNLDTKLLYPKTIKGVTKVPGVWDYEGCYSRFKTLGAKRYLYEEDNELYLTVAGLSKRNGIEYMKKVNNFDNTKVFEFFNDDMFIPEDETGKNTHTYIDREKTYKITDYQGKTKEVTSLSSIHLEKASYSLSLSQFYIDFYKSLQRGQVFKGAY